MSEEKKIKVSHSLGIFDFAITIAIFILFLNWVKPNFIPEWLNIVAFWFIVFVLAIIGICLLVVGIAYLIFRILMRIFS